MARKEATVTISTEGRDQGKTFFIREMPAFQAERWAMRAFLALARAGIDIPEDISSAGLAGLAHLGLKAFAGLDYYEAEPLLSEMLSCVQLVPDPTNPAFVRPGPVIWSDEVEEVGSLFTLRAAVWAVHTNFSIPGIHLTYLTEPGKSHQNNTQNMQTSPQPLGAHGRAARHR